MLPIVEDPPQVPRDEQWLRELAEHAERSRVMDLVLDHRPGGGLRKRVAEMPQPGGPTQLTVDELATGLPDLDLRGPSERHAVVVEPIVDQRADLHPYRRGGADLEPQPRRRDPLEVMRGGEERESLFGRTLEPLPAPEDVNGHGVADRLASCRARPGAPPPAPGARTGNRAAAAARDALAGRAGRS